MMKTLLVALGMVVAMATGAAATAIPNPPAGYFVNGR
jgi:hypothetical protein